MAQVLRAFSEELVAGDGTAYRARACARPREDGRWEGWLEFIPLDGGVAVRTARETTQPDERDAEYWAAGLTSVYLEGALERALAPHRVLAAEPIEPPAYEAPAPHPSTRPAPLDPYAVATKGEPLLQIELDALPPPLLRDIVRAYRIIDERRLDLEELSHEELATLIMDAVRRRTPRRRRAHPSAPVL